MPLPNLFFHDRARPRESAARGTENLFAECCRCPFYRRQCYGRKRRRGHPVNHQFEIDLKDAQTDEVFGGNCRRKLLLKKLGIIGADPKDRDRADIAEDRRAHLLLHLFNILMRERQIEFVLASFRKNVREAFVRERLKFVHEEIEIGEFLECGFIHIRAAHCGEIYFSDEH